MRGHIVGKILTLKPCYVPGIAGPMGRGIQMTGAYTPKIKLLYYQLGNTPPGAQHMCPFPDCKTVYNTAVNSWAQDNTKSTSKHKQIRPKVFDSGSRSGPIMFYHIYVTFFRLLVI